MVAMTSLTREARTSHPRSRTAAAGIALFQALLLASLLLLGACASGTPRTGARAVELSSELGLPDTTSASGAYSGESEYRLGPQDLLEINVFQVQELNRTVRINSGGDISLPLVGVLRAGGLTVRELEQSIAAALSKDFLQDPQVSVFVKEYTSQRVTLEGAVKKPGIYPLSGRTTLLQAIATGGGLDPLANLQGVVVFRTVEGKKMAAVFDMQAIRTGQVADPQVYGDDVIVVDQSNSKTALRRFIESVPAFSLFLLL
ncbi:MAG TPA: polysaccharide biosynthesis/export family protein [Dokdonella sp.]